MAITQKNISSDTTANNWAFKATENTAITTIHLCNITSADATANVYILPDDGSSAGPTENNKIYNNLLVQAEDTYIIDTEKLILSTGDKIFVETPDSAGSIVATISTIGL